MSTDKEKLALFPEIPPDYAESATSSASGAPKASSAKPIRYLYYQMFEDGMVTMSKQPIPGYDEPSIGRIRARDIAPPRTVGIIKHAIAKAESVDPSRITGLYLLASGNAEAADNNARLDIIDERGRGPGGSPEVPIGIVLGPEHEEIGNVIMSHSEPGRAATGDKPKGWKEGKTSGNNIYLGLALKPKGGLRWLDGTVEAGKRIYVDTANLNNVSDWSKTYSMYPVIIADTRDYGFMPADSIELDPEPAPSKGKSTSSALRFFRRGST